MISSCKVIALYEFIATYLTIPIVWINLLLITVNV